MNKILGFFPAIIIVVSVSILGVIILLEGNKNKPCVVTDEAGNEFTLGLEGSQPSRISGKQ